MDEQEAAEPKNPQETILEHLRNEMGDALDKAALAHTSEQMMQAIHPVLSTLLFSKRVLTDNGFDDNVAQEMVQHILYQMLSAEQAWAWQRGLDEYRDDD